MSLKIRELIKKVRACKTAEEERSVINKESAEMRNMSKEATNQVKCRNIAKCIYMHMMGKNKFYS
jgi:AP-1 complex subunit gamma-1